MREIVLDTETTGFDPLQGDRIVEIGCVELINHLPSGKVYHQYINPERHMPEEAFKVHGLSDQFLSDKPVFAEIVADFREFIGDAPLVIHNAEFDMKFIDTVVMARKKFPGSPANLDALCRRFEIDNSNRTFHGALLDSELLAEVYLQLIGGRQPGFELGLASAKAAAQVTVVRQRREPRPHAAGPEELEAHAGFIAKLKNAIWLREPEAEEAKAG